MKSTPRNLDEEDEVEEEAFSKVVHYQREEAHEQVKGNREIGKLHQSMLGSMSPSIASRKSAQFACPMKHNSPFRKAWMKQCRA